MGNIRVGFGRKDFTPDFSVPLAGYGNSNKRMSQGWLTRVYATCIAITDSDNETTALCTLDLLLITKRWGGLIKRAVAAATGIREDRVMLCCTHSHSSPDTTSAVPSIGDFYTLLIM